VKTPAELAQHMYRNAKSIIESGREAIPMLGLVGADDRLIFVGIPWSSPVEVPPESAAGQMINLFAPEQVGH